MVTTETLTLTDFFLGIFPGSYICAMKPGHGQYQGETPFPYLCQKGEAEIKQWAQKWIDLNNQGYGIHFTPNALKDGSESNKAEYFDHVNAWWVDIDIEATKQIPDGDTALLALRREEKDKILANIFSSKFPNPSVLNETRNGYQAIWFSLDGKTENFERIQKALVDEFNGDPAASLKTSMLRVPEMKYYKNGETGVIQPQFLWSTCKLYSEVEMLEHSPLVFTPPKPIPYFALRITPTAIRNYGIWSQIDKIPIEEQIARLSGHPLVNGEILEIKKKNIWANGKPTPNWINQLENALYSRNSRGSRSILQFCMWYGHDKEAVTEGLKQLFNIT